MSLLDSLGLIETNRPLTVSEEYERARRNQPRNDVRVISDSKDKHETVKQAMEYLDSLDSTSKKKIDAYLSNKLFGSQEDRADFVQKNKNLLNNLLRTYADPELNPDGYQGHKPLVQGLKFTDDFWSRFMEEPLTVSLEAGAGLTATSTALTTVEGGLATSTLTTNPYVAGILLLGTLAYSGYKYVDSFKKRDTALDKQNKGSPENVPDIALEDLLPESFKELGSEVKDFLNGFVNETDKNKYIDTFITKDRNTELEFGQNPIKQIDRNTELEFGQNPIKQIDNRTNYHVPTTDANLKPIVHDNNGVIKGIAGFDTKKEPLIGSLGLPLKTQQNDKYLENLSGKTYSLGYDLGLLLANVSQLMATDNIKDYNIALEIVCNEQPHLAYLLSPVSTYITGSIKNEVPDYSEIYRVYNGRSLRLEDVYVKRYTLPDGTIKDNFCIVDEVGQEQEYFAGQGYLPSIMPGGYWAGPAGNSASKPQYLFDLYCFLHDISYQDVNGSYFNLVGDLQLISRIEQNYDRMTEYERPYAEFTVRYFSTIGYMIANLTRKTQLSLNMTEGVLRAEQGIFSVLVRNNSDVNARKEFYRGLHDGLQSAQVSLGSGTATCHMISTDLLSNLRVVSF